MTARMAAPAPRAPDGRRVRVLLRRPRPRHARGPGPLRRDLPAPARAGCSLTGPQKDLYDLSIGGFKLAAMEVPEGERAPGGDGPFLHSSKFVLVDGEA